MTYEGRSDAAFIYFDEIEAGGDEHTVQVESDHLSGMVNVDLDRKNRVVGIEVLGASKVLPTALLAKLRDGTNS